MGLKDYIVDFDVVLWQKEIKKKEVEEQSLEEIIGHWMKKNRVKV